MRSPRRLLFALLALSLPLLGQDPPGEEGTPADEAAPAGEGNGNGAKHAAPEIPGFVYVNEGPVKPGCDFKDFKERHRGNKDLEKTLLYEVWGAIPPFNLEGFYIGYYDVTNAQWKAYLDAEHRVVHKTGKGETLAQIAGQYVQFRGQPMVSEWKALYALNWKTIVEAWKNDAQPAKEGKEAKPATWNPAWQVEDPPQNLDLLPLPEGLELVFYRRRVPTSWYGWCKLSELRLDGEYCDIRKPAAEAFQVPDEAPYNTAKLRAKDFAAYPIRFVSPIDQLEFAEWCGCHLPSEYEYERAVAGDQVQNQFTFGAWNHTAQKTLFPWADNPRVVQGEAPFPVDDPSCKGSVSPFGAWMLHGNVWRLTRTFFDIHPNVKPEPPPPDPNLNNYALIAKGGSYGDGWSLVQRSVRADKIGVTGWLTLDSPNRADTLGVRLVRHVQPGRDLLMHSILGLTYDTGRALWIEPTLIPLSFDYTRMAGVEHFHPQPSGSPYIHFTRPAEAVAFVPLYFSEIDDRMVKDAKRDWAAGKAEPSSFAILGALRSDVPLAGGRRLSNTEADNLREERRKYDEKMKIWKGLSASKRKNLVEPEKPENYEPDDYEKLTEKNSETCGLWRNGTIKPGAYYVVFWNGFIGLTNKARTMPPDLIFAIEDPAASVKRNRRAAKTAPGGSTLALDAEKDRIRLVFEVEEQESEAKKKHVPPSAAESSTWAMCEVQPERWTGGWKSSGYVWAFDVTLTAPSGTLKAWNTTQGRPRRSETIDRSGEPVKDGLKTPETKEPEKKEDEKENGPN